jgi:hypothetical protein
MNEPQSNDLTNNLIVSGYAIDEKLLEKKAITRCQISGCKAGCCADGVWLDVGQADAILKNAEMIQPFMPEARRDTAQWFAELHNDDPAFPSGQYTGTTTVEDASHPSGTTCIFLRPEDRYCAIQVASVANGLSSWDLKPFYCCLFPVVDEYVDANDDPLPIRRLTMDDTNSLFERGGGCHDVCVCEPQSVFQIYAEEVSLALGVEGYRELCEKVGEPARL